MDLQKKLKKNSTRDYDARWFHPSVRDAHTRAHFAIFSDIVVHKIAKIKKLNSYRIEGHLLPLTFATGCA